jgi:hypothetical protein
MLWKLGVGYDDETGPNDASRVVWAIGMIFFYISCFFLILTNNSRLYLRFGRLGWATTTKRAQTTCHDDDEATWLRRGTTQSTTHHLHLHPQLDDKRQRRMSAL